MLCIRVSFRALGPRLHQMRDIGARNLTSMSQRGLVPRTSYLSSRYSSQAELQAQTQKSHKALQASRFPVGCDKKDHPAGRSPGRERQELMSVSAGPYHSSAVLFLAWM